MQSHNNQENTHQKNVLVWPGTCIQANENEHKLQLEKITNETFRKRKSEAFRETINFCQQGDYQNARSSLQAKRASLKNINLIIIDCECLCHEKGFQAAEDHTYYKLAKLGDQLHPSYQNALVFYFTVERLKALSPNNAIKPENKLTIFPLTKNPLTPKKQRNNVTVYAPQVEVKPVLLTPTPRSKNAAKDKFVWLNTCIEATEIERKLPFEFTQLVYATAFSRKESIQDVTKLCQQGKYEEARLTLEKSNAISIKRNTKIIIDCEELCNKKGFNAAKENDLYKLAEANNHDHYLYEEAQIFYLTVGRLQHNSDGSDFPRKNFTVFPTIKKQVNPRKRTNNFQSEPQIPSSKRQKLAHIKQEPQSSPAPSTLLPIVPIDENKFKEIAKKLRGKPKINIERTDCSHLAEAFLDYVCTGNEPNGSLPLQSANFNQLTLHLSKGNMPVKVKEEPGLNSDKDELTQQVYRSVIDRSSRLGQNASPSISFPPKTNPFYDQINVDAAIINPDDHIQSRSLYTDINIDLLREAESNGGKVCGFITLHYSGEQINELSHTIPFVAQTNPDKVLYIDAQQSEDSKLVVSDLSQLFNFCDQPSTLLEGKYGKFIYYTTIKTWKSENELKDGRFDRNEDMEVVEPLIKPISQPRNIHPTALPLFPHRPTLFFNPPPVNYNFPPIFATQPPPVAYISPELKKKS